MSHAFVTIEKQTFPLFAVGSSRGEYEHIRLHGGVSRVSPGPGQRATFIHTASSHRKKYSEYGPVAFVGNQEITEVISNAHLLFDKHPIPPPPPPARSIEQMIDRGGANSLIRTVTGDHPKYLFPGDLQPGRAIPTGCNACGHRYDTLLHRDGRAGRRLSGGKPGGPADRGGRDRGDDAASASFHLRRSP